MLDVAAALVLDQNLVDSFYGAVKTLVTVDPNPAVKDGPDWFKLAISASMLIALLFAAAFTGGLVERLIGRRLTGLLGRRAVPRSDHVVVVGLGQVGLRLSLLLRRCGTRWSPRRRDDGGSGAASPGAVVIAAAPTHSAQAALARHALALVAVTNDYLQNIAHLRTRSGAVLRLVLRAGSSALRRDRSLAPRPRARACTHRAVYLAGLRARPALHVVLTLAAHLRDADGA